MCALGFLNKHNAPTPEAFDSLPSDLECPSDEQIAKTVVIFHGESTFQANDDQMAFLGAKDMTFLRLKGKGAGMVSDFIDEHNGYLKLTDEEYERSKTAHPGINQYGWLCGGGLEGGGFIVCHWEGREVVGGFVVVGGREVRKIVCGLCCLFEGSAR